MEQSEAQTGKLGEIEQVLPDPALYDNASQDRMERLFQRPGELRWSLENLEVEWMEAKAALNRADPAWSVNDLIVSASTAQWQIARAISIMQNSANSSPS